jgi:cysteine desulfurase family protein
MTVYLDNAATCFPKPEPVCQAVDQAMRHSAANPGRGGHRLAVSAARLVMETREAVARLIGAEDAARIVFTANATEAINLALFGSLQPGHRVVTTSMEHNAVVRPLRALEERGVEVVKVQADQLGFVSPADIKAACDSETRLVVMTHCSNVSGTLQATEDVGPWCRQNGILFLVDAAQSAGLFPIDVEAQAIDLLAVPGHKGLMGPPGTGFLYVREGLSLQPLLFGGTGNLSESEFQPEEMPERLESGTLNTVGLAGLKAGLEFIENEGREWIRRHERSLLEQLIVGLKGVPGVALFGPLTADRHGGALSFNLAGQDPSVLGFQLDHEYGICCRVGLHCAPEAHRSIGSFPLGTVRVSPGYLNTTEDVDKFLMAMHSLSRAGK